MTKKILITNKTKEKRLKFALNTIYQPGLIDLLVFSDEKRFYFNGLNYDSRIWSHIDDKQINTSVFVPKNLEKNSLMVWGAVGINGKVCLQLCENTVGSIEYIEILKRFLEKAVHNYPNNCFLLVEDNATPHVSKITNKFKEDKEIYSLEWPPSSPDLNIIENAWKILSDKVYGEQRIFFRKKDLWGKIQAPWEQIDDEMIKQMIKSFDDRLSKVIEAGGGLINE